jgi:hypothetical protein
MLNAFMLNVILLSAVAPFKYGSLQIGHSKKTLIMSTLIDDQFLIKGLCTLAKFVS